MKTCEEEKMVFSMENDWQGVLLMQVGKSRAGNRGVKYQVERLEEMDQV